MIEFIIATVVFAMLVACADFLIYGRKLANGIKLTAPQLIIFYFGRTMVEWLMFLAGIVIGVKLSS